ncbi:MAG TPA: hypothetical protein VMT00_04415 [Thermoanaerobaculia bacterium]|nr:hypothetical protein [Thermoanaerobaculia bacterium]
MLQHAVDPALAILHVDLVDFSKTPAIWRSNPRLSLTDLMANLTELALTHLIAAHALENTHGDFIAGSLLERFDDEFRRRPIRR